METMQRLLWARKAIALAFEDAWADIADHFGNDPGEIDSARYKLATALLSIANEDSRDVEVQRKAALLRMPLDYRDTTPTTLKRHASKQSVP